MIVCTDVLTLDQYQFLMHGIKNDIFNTQKIKVGLNRHKIKVGLVILY